MKTKFTILSFASLFTFLFSNSQSTSISSSSLPPGVSGDWYTDATEHAKQVEYNFYPAGDHFRVTNTANHARFEISAKGYTAYPMQLSNNKSSWQVGMTLAGISRGKQHLSFEAGGQLVQENNELTDVFDFAGVQYLNDDKGLRQNFIVSEKLPGNGQLAVSMKISSSLSERLINSNKLVFYTEGY